ncbi:hypothetical protein [Streptomyces sp. NPDC018059]|uniref:hypothetical protein n=1 Tax=Streptomyces sp. NPDC018059 TaxID=3365041 RepID=UPI0037B414F6
MDLDTLRSANFKLLDDAVTDWSRMVDNFDDLKEGAERGLKGAANKADWTGYNATVSKAFIGKTAGEFDDAHTQAKSIWNILRDTRDELVKHRDNLREVIEGALKKNLTVTPTSGGGYTVSMNIHPDRAAKGTSLPEHDQNSVNALRDEIQKILDKASESDRTASMVLQAIADQSTLGFSDANYRDRDVAVAAVKEADALSKLAQKNPADLSVAEFDRLNAGLRKYADDELFSQRFATQLGAKGTLEFWADINDPNANPQLNDSRHEKFDELQKNLSLTLATATQSDALGMTEWTSKVVDLGNRPVSNSGVMGFQVMSNLMRWGDYDDQFLRDYGTRLMETEKKLTDNGDHGAWRRTGTDPYLNRTGSDTGWDPMTGYMKSLSNSPHAATAFFNEDFTPKGGDGDSSKDKGVSNFEYLFEERDWPSDIDADASDTGRNTMALALEAATTGHPAGELPTKDMAPHNAEQAKLMESLVSAISNNPSNLTDHGYMSDSIGQIASEYLPDLNRAITDAPAGDESVLKLFPVSGNVATMSHVDVTRFLVTLGQNPEGYAAVEVGQKDYMANLMDYHLNPDLPADRKYPNSTENAITEIARRSAEIGGTLAIGRQEAVLEAASAQGSDFDNAVSQKKNFLSGAIGTGIGVGVGVSFVASPVAGAAVGGAAGTVSTMVLEQLFKDAESGSLSDTGRDAAILWEDSKDKNGALSLTAADRAAMAHGGHYSEQVAGWVRQGNTDGFNDASTAGRRMSDDLTTEIQR